MSQNQDTSNDIRVSEILIDEQQSIPDQIDQNDISEDISNGSKDVHYEILDY